MSEAPRTRFRPPGPIRNGYARLEAALPRGLRERIQCARRAKHWRRTGMIFIHVPKAAGTSISWALYGRSLGHIRAEAIRDHDPALYARATVFSVVRNPFDRAVSAYEFARRGGTLEAGASRGLRRAASSWSGFADFVTGYLADLDLETADFVFQTQSSFVSSGRRTIVPHLFRFEAMEEIEAFLADRHDPHFRLGAMNVTRTAPPNGEAGGWRAAYRGSAELIDTVARRYAEDIERFGYDF